ncbi:hypothetical protein Dimus_003633 [Dionaea muscipula]
MIRESWMNDNGLSKVMDLIKRQRWEKQFNRRELMHVDACKEFYAKLTMSHNKKKEVAKSSVRGVDIEFYNEKLASILGIPGNNGICEYIKEVWEESKYTKPLEITRNFTNDNTIMEARRVRSIEMKPFQRRRDDEIVAPAEEEEKEEEAQNADFDWEEVVDEGAVQGKSGSDDQFFDAQVDVEEPVAEVPVVPAFPTSPGDSTTQQKEPEAVGVDPSGPPGHISESVMIKLQAEFERARANRIQADLEKAQAENARLLALLQQAKSPPKP